MNKSNLSPSCVFDQFKQINQIPRPSKHEEKMVEYLKEFAKKHGLDVKVDAVNNVIIRKPATERWLYCKAIPIWCATSWLT